MSTVIAKNIQIGTSGTPAQNFTWYQPASPDGTVRLGVGNSGVTTGDVITATSAGVTVSGSVTGGAGSFTTLAASSTVSGTGFSNYLASPPAIGGTTPAAVSSTNLSYTGTLTGGTGIVNLGSGQFYKDASGNVGIGTSSPARRLHVFSSTAAEVAVLESTVLSSDNVQLRFRGTSGERWAIGNNVATGGTGVNFDFYDLTASANRVRIDGSGNLLVGTTSTPTASCKFAVFGGANYTFGLNSGSFTWYAGTAGNSYNFYDGGGTLKGYLTSSGTFTNTSDIAFKKDITPIPYGLADVMNLRAVSYRTKDYDEPQIGFIAQEMELIVPEVVSGEEGSKGIAYGNITALLTAAIQEQQALIESLTARIAALEAK